MSGSGREALPHVQEWSGDAPNMTGSGREATECPGLVGKPPRCPGLVQRSSSMSRSGRQALLDDREWSRPSPGCPSVIEGPSRMFGSGR